MENAYHFLNTRGHINFERKIFHIVTGIVVYLPYFLLGNQFPALYWFLLLLTITFFTEIIRLKVPSINNYILSTYRDLFRKTEAKQFCSVLPFITGMLLSSFLFPPYIAHIAVGCQIFSDPIASAVGIRFGKRKIWDGKSLEGFLACFVVSMVICTLILSIRTEFSWNIFILSILTGFVASMAEAYPIPYVDDNLRVSLFTGTALYILIEKFNFLFS